MTMTYNSMNNLTLPQKVAFPNLETAKSKYVCSVNEQKERL